MTASSLVILAMTLASPPQAPAATPAAQADARKPITLTGCVVAATDREDTLQLVAAEPEPGRPVGTTGASPAWTVPSYLLLGGMVRFSEHANRTVEITGILEPAVEAPADPKKTGDTTSRAAPPAPPAARLQVQHAKVVASTCTPKKDK